MAPTPKRQRPGSDSVQATPTKKKKTTAPTKKTANQLHPELTPAMAEQALARNPLGVRLLHERVSSSQTLMAGYLGLADTDVLRQLMTTNPVSAILDNWHENSVK
ncbi:MAG: hypothetical protein Q9182_007647, partial [Xanthomendoza sp. 2 TL-2023]